MTSRYVKPLLALLVLLGVSLPFTATTTAAPPAGLNWEVHGTGSGGANVVLGVSSSGPAMPQYVGNAMYVLSFSLPAVLIGNNGDGGSCFLINGTGSVTAADGSMINLLTVGMLCNVAGATSTFHYNGTYHITGGTDRFVGVAGGGSLTVTFGSPHFIKIDGTITGI